MNIGPEISFPAGSFEYSGSIVGFGMKAQLNNNLSPKWAMDVYADYHIFFGSLKSDPKPPYKPRMLSLMPGIKLYLLPVLFIGYNMGIAGIGGVNKSKLKGRFSYAPSLGISFPAHTNRFNISLGYVRIVDTSKPTDYLNAGVVIRVF